MLKDLFLLDPNIVFLNHGSFGACPRIVFDKYQAIQRELELQPVQFLGVKLDEYLYHSRQELARFLNASPNELVYITNATHGINIIARSLKLDPGDEILSTDHEYGACIYTWEFISEKTGAVYKQQPIKLPIQSFDEAVEQLWQGVSPRTKALYLSHITSPTAMTLPIKQICSKAKEAGILTIIDGAHGPGQLMLDLTDLNADFYVGNCHKWMLSPKGAGFLYARHEVQHLIEPLIVSWGYQSRRSKPKESNFIDYLQWTGTKDPSAALAVPTAIEFMRVHHWDDVREECHDLLKNAIVRISAVTGKPPLYPIESCLFQQMATLPIPRINDMNKLKLSLYEEFHIEIPCIEWNKDQFIRISVQGYNTAEDLDKLIDALTILLPRLKY